MAPATIMIDSSDDFVSSVSPPKRTLLLAPPSLAANSSALSSVVSEYDRSVTDLQMLDRLSAGLVQLPTSTYDLVLILADASSVLSESLAHINRTVLGPVAESLKPSGRLQAQNGNRLDESTLSKEAVLAGLVASRGGFEKPDYGDNEGAVSLKFGLKKKKQNGAVPLSNGAVSLKAPAVKPTPQPIAPAGVGFIDLSDDLDDDDLIDEDTLMTEEDLLRPINIRMFAQPPPDSPLANTDSPQPPNASPSPASVVALARTAPVVSPSVWRRKIPKSAPRLIRSSRVSNWPPTTWLKSILPFKAKSAPAVTAL